MNLEESLFWIGHASFYLKLKDYTVFVDPFRVSEKVKEKADLVLLTHAHFDHCSKSDIGKVVKSETKFVAPSGCLDSKEYGNVVLSKPGFKTKIDDIGIEAVPAYNFRSERLQYHPRSNGWVGYIIEAEGTRIYHTGDTDFIPEMKKLGDIDIALLPMGGTYTMTVDEAVEAARAIAPKRVVPMHYKMILGRDGAKLAEEKAARMLDNVRIMKEVQEPIYAF